MSNNPIAFMSYVRMDDAHENGRLSQFRERLSGEVRMQTGEAFEIFQDRNDIAWGQQWQQRIDGALDAVTFLIPIITPAFFKSPACRDEFERFLKREENLGRTDLILPVYYVECPVLSNEGKRETDSIAKVIAARQYADWRDLRHEPFTASEVGRRFASIAKQIVKALERDEPFAHSTTRPTEIEQPSKIDSYKTEAASLLTVSERPTGPSPKTEVPTIIVDAMHRGHYSTLTEALKAARPGTRILVRPGLYHESVIIDKPVEIIGDGNQSDIVIEAIEKSVILFQCSMGRIANLTLRQMGGEGSWFCVDIAQGRLDLEDCDITAQGFACVAIHNGADPRLRRNIIHNGKGIGISLYSNGLGTLEENEIYGNKYGGIDIREGSNPLFFRNRIHDCQEGGVLVHINGKGVLEDNEIYGNAFSGVEIRSGGNPTLRRNRITRNGLEGVRLRQGSGGFFEDNDLRGNARGAWWIDAESKSKVIRKGNIEHSPD